MACSLPQRYEKFSTCFVNEFEMYIKVQRIILEDKTTKNDRLKGIAMGSIKEMFSARPGLVGKTLGGVKDYIMDEKKLDMAGKIVTLIDKYESPEEKQAIRALLVRVAYELFKSYEHQFMHAEKSVGGWSQAMVQLARTAVWCFMHYYKFKPQEDLDEKYVLEAITLKNMPSVSIWKNWYYKDGKQFTKVTNTEDQVKCDGVKIFSKAGIVLEENQKRIYLKNDSTKPEKYGFRRIFSHENSEIIKSEFTKEVKSNQTNYQYVLDMGTTTKETMCEKILQNINNEDVSLMEKRLLENMKRITENIVDNLMCEMMEQIVATLNGLSLPAATSSTTVNNETTSNQDFVCHTQTAQKIQNLHKPLFQGSVNMTF